MCIAGVVCLHKTPVVPLPPMGLSKMHNPVGCSSQEEESVQGLGGFLEAALFIYEGETNSCVTQQQSSHRKGFLCSQFPTLFWPSTPPKSPLSLGFSQGHTLCLLRYPPLSPSAPPILRFSSWAAWLHTHTHLFPNVPSQSLRAPKENRGACGLSRDLCAGWRSQTPPFAFPSRLRGLFEGKAWEWGLIWGLPY